MKNFIKKINDKSGKNLCEFISIKTDLKSDKSNKSFYVFKRLFIDLSLIESIESCEVEILEYPRTDCGHLNGGMGKVIDSIDCGLLELGGNFSKRANLRGVFVDFCDKKILKKIKDIEKCQLVLKRLQGEK